jgi:hypothetical protein
VRSDGEGCVHLARGADVDDPLTVIVVPDDRCRIRPDQAPDLVADRREDLVGSDAARHQRRHAPERCLLVDEAYEGVTRLGVLDRRRQQLGEAGQTRRGVVRQRDRLRGGTDDRSPEATGDDDRNPDRGTDPGAPDERRQLTVQPRVVVDAGSRGAVPDEPKDVRAVDRPPDSDREPPFSPVEVGALARCAVELVPRNADGRDIHEAGDLLGDDGEEVRRLHALRDERRDAVQRGQLGNCSVPVRDVPCHSVHDIFARSGVRAARGPANRAVSTGQATLEPGRALPLRRPFEDRADGLDIVQQRPGQQLIRRASARERWWANVTDPSNPAMQDASSDRSRSCTSSLLTSRLVRLTLPSVGLPYAWRKGAMDAPLFRLRGPHSSIPDAAPDRAAVPTLGRCPQRAPGT